MNGYYQHIDGWCDFHNLYYDLLINVLPENSTFVEVGSWHGHSMCFAAEILKFHRKKINLFAIDIFASELDNSLKPYSVSRNESSCYSIFLNNMAKAGVLNMITPIAMFSEDASKLFENNSIDCVFIDAAHDKENVINDLQSWIPKVKMNGLVTGHDYEHGIRSFIDEFFKNKFNTIPKLFPPRSFVWNKNNELHP